MLGSLTLKEKHVFAEGLGKKEENGGEERGQGNSTEKGEKPTREELRLRWDGMGLQPKVKRGLLTRGPLKALKRTETKRVKGNRAVPKDGK